MIIFNEALTTRYYTLERNIKSKSNSFYDSYLDLLEATIKFFLDENNIEYDDSRTCGYIVKVENIKEFLLNIIKVDDYTYNKLPDYIKKCNDHKHKKEKCLQMEGIINYLKVYFDLVNYYHDFQETPRFIFDANYFISIFGETEKQNHLYKDELEKLKTELKESYEQKKLSEHDIEVYKNIVSSKNIELLSLDEQNQRLQSQVNSLKDVKLNSMENKLNKTIDLLNSLQEYLVESRAATSIAVRLINGKSLSDDDLKKEKLRMGEKTLGK